MKNNKGGAGGVTNFLLLKRIGGYLRGRDLLEDLRYLKLAEYRLLLIGIGLKKVCLNIFHLEK